MKYSRLSDYLKALSENEKRLTFAEISEIVGHPLPRSALEYRSWWGNDRTHTQATAWMGVGWRVASVHLSVVRFVRVAPQCKPEPNPKSPSRTFLSHAQNVMSEALGTRVGARRIEGIPRAFSLVSANGEYVGDARFMRMSKSRKTPTTSHNVISESVWLLGKTESDRLFLVFGNEKAVATSWLEKYGHLLGPRYMIYFLPMAGQPEILFDGWAQRKEPTVTPPTQRRRWFRREPRESVKPQSAPKTANWPSGKAMDALTKPKGSIEMNVPQPPLTEPPIQKAGPFEPVERTSDPVQMEPEPTVVPSGCPHRYLKSLGLGTPKGASALKETYQCRACGKTFVEGPKKGSEACGHKNLVSRGMSIDQAGKENEAFECISCGRTFLIK